MSESDVRPIRPQIPSSNSIYMEHGRIHEYELMKWIVKHETQEEFAERAIHLVDSNYLHPSRINESVSLHKYAARIRKLEDSDLENMDRAYLSLHDIRGVTTNIDDLIKSGGDLEPYTLVSTMFDDDMVQPPTGKGTEDKESDDEECDYDDIVSIGSSASAEARKELEKELHTSPSDRLGDVQRRVFAAKWIQVLVSELKRRGIEPRGFVSAAAAVGPEGELEYCVEIPERYTRVYIGSEISLTRSSTIHPAAFREEDFVFEAAKIPVEYGEKREAKRKVSKIKTDVVTKPEPKVQFAKAKRTAVDHGKRRRTPIKIKNGRTQTHDRGGKSRRIEYEGTSDNPEVKAVLESMSTRKRNIRSLSKPVRAISVPADELQSDSEYSSLTDDDIGDALPSNRMGRNMWKQAVPRSRK